LAPREVLEDRHLPLETIERGPTFGSLFAEPEGCHASEPQLAPQAAIAAFSISQRFLPSNARGVESN
jgi:hypothetical protein